MADDDNEKPRTTPTETPTSATNARLADLERRIAELEAGQSTNARPTGTAPSGSKLTLQVLRAPLGSKVTVNGQPLNLTNTNEHGTRAVVELAPNDEHEVSIEARGFKSRRETVSGVAGEIREFDASLEIDTK